MNDAAVIPETGITAAKAKGKSKKGKSIGWLRSDGVPAFAAVSACYGGAVNE